MILLLSKDIMGMVAHQLSSDLEREGGRGSGVDVRCHGTIPAKGDSVCGKMCRAWRGSDPELDQESIPGPTNNQLIMVHWVSYTASSLQAMLLTLQTETKQKRGHDFFSIVACPAPLKPNSIGVGTLVAEGEA